MGEQDLKSTSHDQDSHGAVRGLFWFAVGVAFIFVIIWNAIA